jgi:hypothetical protein
MIIRIAGGLDVDLDEFDIRRWFSVAPLEDAKDTARVIEGIIEGRLAAEPKRKRRSDAGQSRDKDAAANGLFDK